MMRIGIIGTGTMGGMLAQTLVRSGALQPQQVMLHNRTYNKAQAIAGQHRGMTVSDSLPLLTEHCNILFLCIKPMEHPDIISELRSLVSLEHIVITITSPVLIADLESCLNAKIGKLIPSITNSIQSGVALYCFGERFTANDRESVLRLIRSLGQPLEIDERHTRIASDLSSCGPAFLSQMLNMWISAAHRQTGLNPAVAQQTLAQMLLGLGALLAAGDISPDDIIAKVAVPGGITATGLRCIQEQCGPLFDTLTELTHEKFAEDLTVVQTRLEPLSLRQC